MWLWRAPSWPICIPSLIGRVALQQHMALLMFAPRAAGNLLQQLEGVFRSAQIAAGKAQIRIDHAYQREVREMVAFGQHLRADQHARVTRYCIGHGGLVQPGIA